MNDYLVSFAAHNFQTNEFLNDPPLATLDASVHAGLSFPKKNIFSTSSFEPTHNHLDNSHNNYNNTSADTNTVTHTNKSINQASHITSLSDSFETLSRKNYFATKMIESLKNQSALKLHGGRMVYGHVYNHNDHTHIHGHVHNNKAANCQLDLFDSAITVDGISQNNNSNIGDGSNHNNNNNNSNNNNAFYNKNQNITVINQQGNATFSSTKNNANNGKGINLSKFKNVDSSKIIDFSNLQDFEPQLVTICCDRDHNQVNSGSSSNNNRNLYKDGQSDFDAQQNFQPADSKSSISNFLNGGSINSSSTNEGSSSQNIGHHLHQCSTAELDLMNSCFDFDFCDNVSCNDFVCDDFIHGAAGKSGGSAGGAGSTNVAPNINAADGASVDNQNTFSSSTGDLGSQLNGISSFNCPLFYSHSHEAHSHCHEARSHENVQQRPPLQPQHIVEHNGNPIGLKSSVGASISSASTPAIIETPSTTPDYSTTSNNISNNNHPSNVSTKRLTRNQDMGGYLVNSENVHDRFILNPMTNELKCVSCHDDCAVQNNGDAANGFLYWNNLQSSKQPLNNVGTINKTINSQLNNSVQDIPLNTVNQHQQQKQPTNSSINVGNSSNPYFVPTMEKATDDLLKFMETSKVNSFNQSPSNFNNVISSNNNSSIYEAQEANFSTSADAQTPYTDSNKRGNSDANNDNLPRKKVKTKLNVNDLEQICEWDNCKTTVDPRFFKKHIIKDHLFPSYNANIISGSSEAEFQKLLDSLSPDTNIAEINNSKSNNSLLDSVTDFGCEWSNCDYQSNDLVSLFNHVNSMHAPRKSADSNVNSVLLFPNDTTKPSLTESLGKFNDSSVTFKAENSDQQQFMLHDENVCCWCDNGKHCDMRFKNTTELTDHIINDHIGSGKSKYVCNWENCERHGRTFNQRQKIVRHLHVHTKHKPYKCEECGHCFSVETMLLQHKRVHSGEKPFSCKICGKKFATSSSLSIHTRTHTGEKPLACKFPGCNKRFSESSNLAKHMKIHEKKFKCTMCVKSFDKMQQLENHMLKHEKEKIKNVKLLLVKDKGDCNKN